MASRLFRSLDEAALPPSGNEAGKDEAMRRRAYPVGTEDRTSSGGKGSEKGVPRWMVVCGVVVYCAFAWAAVFHFGGQATDWLVAMWNSDTVQAASDQNLTAP